MIFKTRTIDNYVQLSMRTNEGKWVGSCRIYDFPGTKHCILDHYEIRPEFQGQGLSWLLSAELAQYVDDNGYTRKFAYVPEENGPQHFRMMRLDWTQLGHGYWFKEV